MGRTARLSAIRLCFLLVGTSTLLQAVAAKCMSGTEAAAEFAEPGLPCNADLCSSINGTCRPAGTVSVCCYEIADDNTTCANIIDKTNSSCNASTFTCSTVPSVIQCYADEANVSLGTCRDDIGVRRKISTLVIRESTSHVSAIQCYLEWFFGTADMGRQRRTVAFEFPQTVSDSSKLGDLDKELEKWLASEGYFNVEQVQIETVDGNSTSVRMTLAYTSDSTLLVFTWLLQRTLNQIVNSSRNFTFDGQIWMPEVSSMTIGPPDPPVDDGTNPEDEGPNGSLIVGILFFVIFSIFVIVIIGYNVRVRYCETSSADRYQYGS